jgi:hypothetical protein
LFLLDLLARGRLHFLLLTSDDTSPWGLPSREKAWLEGWPRLLGPSVQERLLIHPGADEVGSALVARLIAEKRNRQPTIFPLYAVPGGEEIVAPYEDRPVRITVEGPDQGLRRASRRDARRGRHRSGRFAPLAATHRVARRASPTTRSGTARKITNPRSLCSGGFQAAGKPVALGDVAYPNGADPLALEMLLDPSCPLDPSRLAAFGAWNTAGNTLGVVVAQAVCSLMTNGDPAREAAQARFLAHRFLEDWGLPNARAAGGPRSA